jgi:hypothetical protein
VHRAEHTMRGRALTAAPGLLDQTVYPALSCLQPRGASGRELQNAKARASYKSRPSCPLRAHCVVDEGRFHLVHARAGFCSMFPGNL